jgi:hypothetical protein
MTRISEMTIPSAIQIAQTARTLVRDALPFKMALLEQLGHSYLPVILSNGSIYGPASNNAAAFELYRDDWTGLALSTAGDKPVHWFIYSDELTQERAFCCLGHQPSVAAALEEAILQVQSNLSFWAIERKAA